MWEAVILLISDCLRHILHEISSNARLFCQVLFIIVEMSTRPFLWQTVQQVLL